MKLYSYIIVNLILSVIVIAISAGPASAECRDKSCMTDEYTFQDGQGAKHTFFYNSVLLLSVEDIRNYAIKKSLELSETNKKSMFLEFGVHRGESINLFANHLKKKNKKIFGFESFQGQPNDWPGYIRKKGYRN